MSLVIFISVTVLYTSKISILFIFISSIWWDCLFHLFQVALHLLIKAFLGSLLSVFSQIINSIFVILVLASVGCILSFSLRPPWSLEWLVDILWVSEIYLTFLVWLVSSDLLGWGKVRGRWKFRFSLSLHCLLSTAEQEWEFGPSARLLPVPLCWGAVAKPPYVSTRGLRWLERWRGVTWSWRKFWLSTRPPWRYHASTGGIPCYCLLVTQIQIPRVVSTNTREEKIGVPYSACSETPPVEVGPKVIVWCLTGIGFLPNSFRSCWAVLSPFFWLEGPRFCWGFLCLCPSVFLSCEFFCSKSRMYMK